MSSGIWTPIPEGPHQAFVERLYRLIAAFGEEVGVEEPVVELELIDSARFVLDKIVPEPGFGMITIYVRPEDADAPGALVIPVGSIKRIELRRLPESKVGFGFSVTPPTTS